MKSWVRALFISAIILATCIFFLPSLAKLGLNSLLPWLMKQADLEQVELYISQLSWHKLSVEHIQFRAPQHNSSMNAQEIEVTFSPWGLLSGQVNTALVENIKLEIFPSSQNHQVRHNSSNSLSDSPSAQGLNHEQTIVKLTSLEDTFRQLPIKHITINKFKLIHPHATVHSQLTLDQQQLIITNNVHSALLKQPLTHNLKLNDQGELSSLVFIDPQQAPIFNLSASWSASQEHKIIVSLQQSADIQSWLKLINSDTQNKKLNAKVAIQALNLNIELPKALASSYQALSQFSAKGLLQIKIDDFSILDTSANNNIIELADLAINLHTDIDHQRPEQWQLKLDKFDLSGEINSLAAIDVKIQQNLEQAINIGCSFLQESHKCLWQGKIKQSILAENLNHTTQITLDGQFNKNAELGSQFVSQQTLSLDTVQENPLWPKGKNSSQGDIIIQGQQAENNWHWQLSLPYGINNQSQYLNPILLTDGKRKSNAKLSTINWQLLPDWQIAGINNEVTSSKALTIIIDQLKLQHNQRAIELDQARLSCNLDWLKLQYSPQLRSQQALSQLPLSCDWQLENLPSQWQKWPIPAFTFKGQLDLTSFDFTIAKLDARMSLTGLANSLDLTLLAQHDFNNLQQGSAQLYLNNLKLDWQKMGLSEMVKLTETQLLEGALSAQGWFKWQQYQTDIFDENSIAWRWQPDLMLRIDDLAGIYQEVTTWEDIDIQLSLRRPFYQDFRIDSQFSALSIHPGIEIANVLARSTTTIKEDFSQALVVIEEVHSDVLGGRINVPLIRFDTSQEINSFGIEVEGLEVEQLAALEAGSGITATGKLDGVLPIILLPEGPQVPAGSLFARSPGGIVKYQGQTADSLKESDPSVGLAMQVLNDFRYHTLQTNVVYQPSGELKLGLKFQGHNPTFFDGQATHFNLNLDYNLLDLLESLRISNDIVQKLENKYQ